MSDRARRTYALLRTLVHGWAPSPTPGGTGAALQATARGFVTQKRFLTCPDCLTNGKAMPGCETCGGRGELPDAGRDPYEEKKFTRFGGIAAERYADQARARDAEILMLDRQLARPKRRVEEGGEDMLDRAIRMRDLLYRHGSYGALERALAWLRDADPQGYEIAMGVVYQPLAEAPVEPSPRVLAVCGVLEAGMPDPIRVPYGVAVYTRDELAAQAKVGKESLWRGRTARHEAKRSERKAMARAMQAEGMTAGEIAGRLFVHKRSVERWLAELAQTAGTAA